MSKLFIENTTLTAIGDAIREKTGKTDLIAPGDMPAEISSITTGGGGDIEPVVLREDQQFGCGGAIASKYIELFGNGVSTDNISNAYCMFRYYDNETIPFEINFKDAVTHKINQMFYGCKNLKSLPKINGCIPSDTTSMFAYSWALREIPEDYFNNSDFSYMEKQTSPYACDIHGMYQYCHSLRKVPLSWMKHTNPYLNYSYGYYQLFQRCYALDELTDLPVLGKKTEWITNAFGTAFDYNHRLKKLTFELDENNQPIVAKWKGQTIDLFYWVGYTTGIKSCFFDYNPGITTDKEVTDDATYQALKNDPDWFTTKVEYSRYNHDSAVETINSLPDTSAYLAEKGGTNTIKFRSGSGSATDGGAINTLTEEEIAVAAAKGWTVTLA